MLKINNPSKFFYYEPALYEIFVVHFDVFFITSIALCISLEFSTVQRMCIISNIFI